MGQFPRFSAIRKQSGFLKFLPAIAIGGIFLFHLFCNIYFISQDNSPFLHEEGGIFYPSSIGFYEAFKTSSARFNPGYLIGYFFTRDSFYPPLVPFTAAIGYCFGGVSQDSAVYSTGLFLLILILSTYKIASYFSGRPVALFAAGLVSLYPMVAGVSRVFYLELPTAALVTLAVYCLLKTDFFRRRRNSCLFGIALALSMLAKWVAFVFLAGPVFAFVIASLIKAKEDRKQVVLNIGLSFGLAVCIMLPFYLILFKHFLRYYSPIFSNTTDHRSFFQAVKFYARDNLDQAQLLPVFRKIFYISLVVFIFRKFTLKYIFLLWLIVPLAFFSLLSHLGYFIHPRFTLPSLPAVALVTSLGLFGAGSFLRITGSLKFIVGAVIIIYGVYTHLDLMFNPVNTTQLRSHELINDDFGRYRPRQEDWKTTEVSAVIIDYAKSNAAREKLMIVPLYSLDHVNLSLQNVLKVADKDRYVLYNLLDFMAGGALGPQELPVYRKLITEESDVILIKEGGRRETGSSASFLETEKTLLELFRQNKQLFDLKLKVDLPDRSVLFVYTRK
jgi:hypothetical protein